MPMCIQFLFEREVSDEFMQHLFTTMTEGASIEYWANPDDDAGEQGYIDWHDEWIIAVYIVESEVVQGQAAERTFKIDGDVIRLGVERLINGEVFAPADELGRLLHAMNEDEYDKIDGEIVDRIVQAGLYGELVFG